MYSTGYFFNAIRRDISMIRGDTMSFSFQIKGLEGQRPTDILFTCKENTEDVDPLFVCIYGESIKETSYDPDKDLLTYSVRVRPAQTAGLDLGRYFYDLEMKVNGDIITLMCGRLAIEAEITTGTTPIPPVVLDGDDIEYPVIDIPAGYMRKYTEQYISDIAEGIKAINGSEDTYTTQEMIAALEGIEDDIIDINSAINAITGSSDPIALSDIADTITDELGIKYESGEEVYY